MFIKGIGTDGTTILVNTDKVEVINVQFTTTKTGKRFYLIAIQDSHVYVLSEDFTTYETAEIALLDLQRRINE